MEFIIKNANVFSFKTYRKKNVKIDIINTSCRLEFLETLERLEKKHKLDCLINEST